MNNNNQEVAGLTGGGALGGNISLGSGTLTVNKASGSDTYDGIISGATGKLTKSGGSTLILTRASTYGGTTMINAGTLLVNGAGSLAAGSAVTVKNTGTLGGSGAVNGTFTVESGGTIALGATGATLTLANAAGPTFDAGATLKILATAATLDKINLSNAGAVFNYNNLALVIDTTGLSGDLTGVTLVDTAMGNGGISGTTFSSVTVTGNTSYLVTVHYNTSLGTITLDLAERPDTTIIKFQ